MTVDIIFADARDGLARFPDGHFHCCVTSPPFWGLRDYGLEPTVWGGDPAECLLRGCEHEWGEPIAGQSQSGSLNGSTLDGAPPGQERRPQWTSAFCRRCNAWRGTLGLEPTPELYVEHLVSVMREVRRVLRDDGCLWLNLGDSYASGKGTCYNPGGGEDSLGQERKAAGVHPLDRGTKSTLAVSGLKPKDLVGVPWMVAFALRADGWWLRSDIVWSKPNPMPESVTDRPTRSHEYLFLLTKSGEAQYWTNSVTGEGSRTEPRRRGRWDEGVDWKWGTRAGKRVRLSLWDGHDYYYDQDAIREERQGNTHSRGTKRNPPIDNAGIGHAGWVASMTHDDEIVSRNRRSVWEIATQPYAKAHFATFPEKLVEPCLLAGTSEWGCCPECGAPWERVVEKGLTAHDGETGSGYPKGTTAKRLAMLRQAARERGGEYENQSQTTGWDPTCDCLMMDERVMVVPSPGALPGPRPLRWQWHRGPRGRAPGAALRPHRRQGGILRDGQA